ncbi:MAG: nucleotidyl transferase AbiEii/AbiGii toxin family protein, partial [Syntrophales bacterium]
TKIIPRKIKGTDFLSGLFIQRQETIVKIEPNLVIRGSVYPPERRIMSPKARGIFEMSVECRTLSADELYAGKMCAALDRQHPRDLFDIHMLLKDGEISASMRKMFIVYLISHERPMVEVLNPGFADIKPVFETEFKDMTIEEISCEDLEKTRENLISRIAKELTVQEKQFIVSVKEGIPRWELIGLEGVANLPAVKWKLVNIGRMNLSKHKEAVRKLRDYLEV